MHMRTFALCLVAVAAMICSGCATRTRDSLEDRVQISYFDRNGDGKVDLEKHLHPGVADADWELRDDDYDGRYEQRILYGFAVTESLVDRRIPTGVKIEKTR